MINNPKNSSIRLVIIAILPVFLLLTSCQQKITVFSGHTMGTTYQIKINAHTTLTKNDIDQELNRLNAIFSTWQTDSEITHINNAPINQWLTLSDELFMVLKSAQLVNHQSNGYFDIGLGNLSILWGFQDSSHTPTTTPNTLTTEKFGQHQLLLSTDKQLKKLAAIKLDLSAIAKGYSVDVLVALIKQHNHNNFLVEIGGEVSAWGQHKNEPWQVAIEIPNQTDKERVALNNQAIATSGDYRNYYTLKDNQYSHILDPQKASPAENNIISVSVIHTETMLADAYATALIAMPEKQAYQFARQHHLKTFFIIADDNRLQHFWLNTDETTTH